MEDALCTCYILNALALLDKMLKNNIMSLCYKSEYLFIDQECRGCLGIFLLLKMWLCLLKADQVNFLFILFQSVFFFQIKITGTCECMNFVCLWLLQDTQRCGIVHSFIVKIWWWSHSRVDSILTELYKPTMSQSVASIYFTRVATCSEASPSAASWILQPRLSPVHRVSFALFYKKTNEFVCQAVMPRVQPVFQGNLLWSDQAFTHTARSAKYFLLTSELIHPAVEIFYYYPLENMQEN